MSSTKKRKIASEDDLWVEMIKSDIILEEQKYTHGLPGGISSFDTVYNIPENLAELTWIALQNAKTAEEKQEIGENSMRIYNLHMLYVRRHQNVRNFELFKSQKKQLAQVTSDEEYRRWRRNIRQTILNNRGKLSIEQIRALEQLTEFIPDQEFYDNALNHRKRSFEITKYVMKARDWAVKNWIRDKQAYYEDTQRGKASNYTAKFRNEKYSFWTPSEPEFHTKSYDFSDDSEIQMFERNELDRIAIR